MSISICSSCNTKSIDIGFSEAELWRLPPELIAMVIDNVSDGRDLASVCRASKTLKAIAEPLLYGKIEVNSNFRYIPGVSMDGSQLFALHKSLLDSDRSSLVTDFRLYLKDWQFYCKSRMIRPGIRAGCHCDEYDDIFRNILSSLHSLRVLHFYCGLCRNPGNNRHGYLPRLDLPYLVVFQFVCHCSFTFSSPQILRIAPYMATVTTLSLDWSSYWSIHEKHIVMEEGVLPNITAMIHNGTVSADSIVVARPISRICRMKYDKDLSGYPHSLHHAVEASPGRLTHLYSSDLLEGLAEFLLESPQPYRHLTSIGTLLFKSYKACVNCSM
jgi:hypothetical protein